MNSTTAHKMFDAAVQAERNFARAQFSAEKVANHVEAAKMATRRMMASDAMRSAAAQHMPDECELCAA